MSSSWPSAFTAEVKFSVAPISMWAPKHRRTQYIANEATLATSPLGTECRGMRELSKDSLVQTFFLTGAQEYRREKLILCVLTHANPHRQQPQLNLTRSWAPGLLCHWEQSTLESLPLAGVSALERYTTPPHEETEFLRMTEQFPLPCPCLWILFPLRNQIQKITPSSQALIFIGSVF